MTKPPKKPSPFPSNEQILEFIRETPGYSGKREIARAFHLDADQKMLLKKALRQLENDGSLQRGRGKKFADPGTLPDVTVIEVSAIDRDGDPIARPLKWDEESKAVIPTIYLKPERRGQPALAIGERVLARLVKTGDNAYSARTIRRVGSRPMSILGIFEFVDGAGRIRPVDKKSKNDLSVRAGDEMGATSGDLVRAEMVSGKLLGLRQAKVIERLEQADGIRSVSLIAVYEHGIPVDFNPEALAQAEAAGPASLGKRTDLRDIPLITIDGADARDFDDAVWAEVDEDPKNSGGWHLLVAIADVSWYVRPGDALDIDARERGNSVYFPDRVVPMLPEALSNGWCSLVPHEPRPCVAVHMWITARGKLLRHKFVRGIMRSAARLTYTQAQMARDGLPDDTTGPLVEPVLAPLYGAYESLALERTKRQALELEMPERQIEIGDDGKVSRIFERERLDSHKLIEEFMITANVAAALELGKKRQPCMYRIHDQPSPEKIEALAEFLKTIDVPLARGQVSKPGIFNQVLKKVAGSPYSNMVNQVILRSQSQAEYSPDNIGHFGLGLRDYCHFTSPIRRYSDLLVHRALVGGVTPDDGRLETDHPDYHQIGEHISDTERRAAKAERSASEKFIAGYLSEKGGATFNARINGVARFGLFVTLDETGADGLVPMRYLPSDYYQHDEAHHKLVGVDSGRVYQIGQEVEVRLLEANPVSGGIMLELMEDGDTAPTKSSAPRKGKGRSKASRRNSNSIKRGNRTNSRSGRQR